MRSATLSDGALFAESVAIGAFPFAES